MIGGGKSTNTPSPYGDNPETGSYENDCQSLFANEDCVHVWCFPGDEYPDDCWDDTPCTSVKPYVCGFPCAPPESPDGAEAADSNLANEQNFQMPRFDEKLQLTAQSLLLRHVRMEAIEVFGGGGSDLGAAISLTDSTCHVGAVEFLGNTQRGVGAGVIFAVGSNATIDFSLFENNRNLGLGAGVVAASAGSRIAVSNSEFRGTVVDNQNGVGGSLQRATCIAADASFISATHSIFKGNSGADVIYARAASVVDIHHTVFDGNSVEDMQSWDSRALALRMTLGPLGPLGNTWRRLQSVDVSPGATISLVEGSVANLISVSFVSNTGAVAGAMFAADEGTFVSLKEVIFRENQASKLDGAAGAIYVWNQARVHAEQCTIDANQVVADVAAGAIHASGGAEVILTDTVLSGNKAAGAVFCAGAVYIERSTVSLLRTTVESNSASGGTMLTESNYADAIHATAPVKLFIKDSAIRPIVWGGKTVGLLLDSRPPSFSVQTQPPFDERWLTPAY
jgi:hypothetical protein